ncbi:MAG: phage shock protein PspA [Alphaproteobacteria bacterium]|nr:phage shock protein PspA [Alphaproteobacteria bacterium]
MSIFSRLADIISANLTVLLDRAEDPEKMIRLMIQEMEETLVEVRASAAKAIADRKDVDRTQGRLRDAEGEWARRAEVALAKDREDLARGALLEKAKLAETAATLAADHAALDEAIHRHEEDITKLAAKLREVRARQQALAVREESATAHLRTRRQLYDGRIQDAFARFERMEHRVDAAESEVQALDLGRGKSLAEQIAALGDDTRIEAELNALKARIKAGGSTRQG